LAEGPGAGAAGQAELLAQLEAELKKLTVTDLLVQTAVSISTLGFRKLGEEGRDLDQARLAIEALRALVPVLEQAVSSDGVRDLNQTVASLQLAYARAVSGR
jgi:hypothetical protein